MESGHFIGYELVVSEERSVHDASSMAALFTDIEDIHVKPVEMREIQINIQKTSRRGPELFDLYIENRLK